MDPQTSNAAIIEQMNASGPTTTSPRPSGFNWTSAFSWIGDALKSVQPKDGASAPVGTHSSTSATGQTLKGTTGIRWRDGEATSGSTASAGLSNGGVMAGGAWGTTGADGSEGGWGFGGLFHKDNWALGGGMERVSSRDDEGNVVDGNGFSTSVGATGAAISGSHVRGGNSTNVGLNLNGEEIGTTVSHQRQSGGNLSGGLSFGDNAYGGEFGGGFKGTRFGGGASASFHVVDDRGMASIDQEGAGGAGGTVADWFDQTMVSYGLNDSAQIGGKLSANVGAVQAGVGGYLASSETTQFHTSMAAVLETYDADKMKDLAAQQSMPTSAWELPKVVDPASLETMDEATLSRLAQDHPKLFQAYMADKYEAQVASARTFEDLDIDELAKGTGMTYQTGEAAGLSGSLGAYGVGVSLGMDDQSIEELTVARTAENQLTVKVAAMDEEAMKAGVSVGGGALGLGATSTEGKSSHVEFTVDLASEDGRMAFEEFQQTGLLPGAMDVLRGKREAQDDIAAYHRKMGELAALDAQLAVAGGGAMVDNPDYNPLGSWFGNQTPRQVTLDERRNQVRAELTQTSGALNKAMLTDEQWGLDKAEGTNGIDYTSHTLAENTSDKTSLSLAGWEWSWGTSFSEYVKKYQNDSGGTEREYGGSKETDYWFDDDERTNIVANPEELNWNGHEIDLGMFSEQDTNRGQRETLASLKYSGMRPELAQGWVDGDFTDAGLVQVSLLMSKDQLDFMNENLDKGDDYWSGVGDHFDEYAITARFPGLRDADPEYRRRVAENYDQSPMIAMGADSSIQQIVEQKRTGNFLEKFYDREAERLVNDGDAGLADLVMMRQNMQKNISGVKSAEDFAALSENEQGIAVGSYVMQQIDSGGDPWDAAHMVLSVDDPSVRAHLFQTLFMTYEHAREGSHAAVDFIEWVQTEGRESGLPQDQIDDLLSGARVELKDNRVNDRAKQFSEAAHDPSKMEKLVGQFRGDADDIDLSETQRAMANAGFGPNLDKEADQAGDWIQAADKAGGPEMVQQLMQQAAGKDPAFAQQLLLDIGRVDATRARVVAEILAETDEYGQFAQDYLDVLTGKAPIWTLPSLLADSMKPTDS